MQRYFDETRVLSYRWRVKVDDSRLNVHESLGILFCEVLRLLFIDNPQRRYAELLKIRQIIRVKFNTHRKSFIFARLHFSPWGKYMFYLITEMNNNFAFKTRRNFLFFLLFLFTPALRAQDKQVEVTVFETVKDFIGGEIYGVKLSAILKDSSDVYLKVKHFTEPSSGKEIKRAINCFALGYQGKKYVNLIYSNDLNNRKMFIKFDISGKYCASFVDNESPDAIKRSGTYYGGGLTGVMISESVKWNKHWQDANGKKRRILFFDTTAPLVDGLGRVNYLTHKQLDKLLEKNGRPERSKDISFEEVAAFINKMNGA